MTNETDTNTDRLHVDVLLADHYPNHDRYCPTHWYHSCHDHHGRQDDGNRHCRRCDSASMLAREPSDSDGGVGE